MRHPAPRHVRAVSIGYQGWGNVGDEAILTGIEAALTGSGIHVRVVAAGPQTVPAWPKARRVPMPRRLPSMALLRAFRQADLLIVSGGGLVNDYWATLIPRYLLLTGMARLLGCRVAWIGVGVGPLRRRASRWLAGRLVEISSLFAVRDTGSATLIRTVSRSPKVVQLPDPAWFNPPPEPGVAASGLAVIVREPAPGDEVHASGLFSALAALLARHTASGERVALLTMQPDADGVAINAIRDRLHEEGLVCEVIALSVNPSEAMHQLAAFEALVSMRLHGLVLGSLAGRPCVPIAYDAKVTAAAGQLGLDSFVLNIASVTTDTVETALRAVSSEAVRAIVRERVTALRSQRPEIARTLGEIL